MPIALLAGIALAVVALTQHSAPQSTPRRAATVAAFKRLNPCPSTGEATGPCPGWIADHIEPLCAGGADDPANMQWQTVEAAKSKDITERATCRALRGAVTRN